MSETWTPLRLLGWTQEFFAKKGVDAPRLTAELLLAHALGCDRVRLYLDFDKPLGDPELARYRELVRRRAEGEPTAYLVGRREFFGHPFQVDARVLVPRPDTEALVEAALERTRSVSMSMRALDLCTGSGCVAVTLAKERPTSTVYATDASEDALAVARENALRLGAYNVALRAGDLYGAVDPALRFDVITANPPYVARGEVPTLMQDVRDFEPRMALEAGDDGLDVIRRVVAGAPAHLVPGGVLAVEVGAGQAPAVAELLRAAGFAAIELRRDYARIERVVSGVLPR